MKKLFLVLVLLVMIDLPSKAQEQYVYCYYQGTSTIKPVIHFTDKTRGCKWLQSDFLKTVAVEIDAKLYEELKDIDTVYRNKSFSTLFTDGKEDFIKNNNKITKFENEWRDALVSHYNKYSGITTATKPSEERNKIADFSKKEIQPKLTEEQIKISKMKPEDRHAYTCTQKFGFRKGSDKFKDCIFELYKAEAELEKLELQKQVAKANADAARANAEAARAGAERQERLAFAQTEAAKMQALAARQQAIAANTADSLALIESGLRMMSPQRPAPRMQTTCTYTGSFMNCF